MKSRSTLHLPVRPGTAPTPTPTPAREFIFPLPQPRARRPRQAELGVEDERQPSLEPTGTPPTTSLRTPG